MIDPSDRPSNVTSLAVRRGSSSWVKATNGPLTLDGLPLMLTVREAAEVLRISRTTAYKLIEFHRTTGGRAGLPHVRLGGRVLVRRVDLAAIVETPPE
jgi:excisionase family DNA binding protein